MLTCSIFKPRVINDENISSLPQIRFRERILEILKGRMKYTDLQLDQEASGVVLVTDQLIDSYAAISKDFNPIHMDDAVAIQAGFAGRIAHGLLCEAEVSRILGTVFPGEGTILLQENFRFIGPVYVGDHITTRIWVTQLIPEKQRAQIDFACTNQNAQPVMTGYALIKLKD